MPCILFSPQGHVGTTSLLGLVKLSATAFSSVSEFDKIIITQANPDVNHFLHQLVLESSRVYPLIHTKLSSTTQKWFQVVDFIIGDPSIIRSSEFWPLPSSPLQTGCRALLFPSSCKTPRLDHWVFSRF